MESRGEGGVREHYLHGAICNRGVQHLGLTHPAMKAKRAWISNAANQPGRTAGLSAAGGLGQMRMNAKKKEKTRRETTAIKVWVTPAEKVAITVKADAYSLSVSTYLRELALRSTRPPTRPGEKINHRGKRTDLQRVRTKVLKRAKHRCLAER